MIVCELHYVCDRCGYEVHNSKLVDEGDEIIIKLPEQYADKLLFWKPDPDTAGGFQLICAACKMIEESKGEVTSSE